MSIKSFLKLSLALVSMSTVFGCASTEVKPRASVEFAQLKVIRSGSLSSEELTSAIWETSNGTTHSDTVSDMIAVFKPGNVAPDASVSALLTVLSEKGWNVVEFEEQFVFHHDILSQRTTYLLTR